MDAQKKTDDFVLRTSGPSTPHNMAAKIEVRNLEKSQLGGVIFGCQDDTINECLHKRIFGSRYNHFTYVQNIEPGLPLFLFNYSDRRLHGVFEAASSGALNINPYGWTKNASEKTQYPAQVQIHVPQHFQSVPEAQFRQIIADNYSKHKPKHFCFELDHAQTINLISLLSSSAVGLSTSRLTITTPDANSFSNGDNLLIEASLNGQSVDDNVEDIIHKKLKKLDFNNDHPEIISESHVNDTDVVLNEEHLKDSDLSDEEAVLKLNSESKSVHDCHAHEVDQKSKSKSLHDCYAHEVDEKSMSMSVHDCHAHELIHRMEAFEQNQIQKTGLIAQKLINAETEIKLLKERCLILETLSGLTLNGQKAELDSLTELNMDTSELIFLVGGFDGRSWLSALNAYSLSENMIKSLKPMHCVRAHAAVAKLNGELYVYGGLDGNSYYDSAESYNPTNNRWTMRPSLNKKKGCLAGASLLDKIYAIGGGIGSEILDDVEILDMHVGRWIPTRSMLQRRTALASTELNGAIYAVGGYDGIYLNSVERFDPRESSWVKVESMKSSRGFHSVVVFHEKLYAFGGYDGAGIVPSVEIYDPRFGKWGWGEPVTRSRSYSAVASFKDSIYVFGGMNDGNCVDTVELFKVGDGWRTIDVLNSTSAKRCYFSAIAL